MAVLRAAVRLSAVALWLLIASCSWLYPPKDLEDTVHSLPALPADADAAALDPLFPVAVQNGRFPVVKEQRIDPPNTLANPLAALGEIRIQRLGQEHWIVVANSASSVWTRLHGFLDARGWAVLRSDVADAKLWVHRKEAEGATKVLLFHIEQGFQVSSSEVHMQQFISTTEGARKVVLSPDMAVLHDLADYFSASQGVPVESLLAHTVRTGKKVRLERNAEDGSTLLLRVSRARAWAAVGKVLRDGNIEILKEDVEGNRYTVSASSGSKSGWSVKRRWFGGAPPPYEILLRAEDSKRIRVLVRPVNSLSKKALAKGEELLLYIKQQLV